MSDNKILFAGPPGVGVTTAIKNISDVPLSVKKEKTNDGTDNEVTVEMDYGILKLDSGDQIYLYGSPPEKEKLKCVHAALNENCIGLIVLVNNEAPDPIATMFQYMEDYKTLVEKGGIAVGLTRYDASPTPDINDYHVALREKKLKIPIFPVFSVDGHEKDDIITIIKALLYSLDSGV